MHVTRDNEVLVSSGPVDDFTAFYVWSLAKLVQEALDYDTCVSNANKRARTPLPTKTRKHLPFTFLVTSVAFTEQLDFQASGEPNLPVFSSCMTSATAATHGIFIPRPYGSTSKPLWSRSVGNPEDRLEQLWRRKRGQVCFISNHDCNHLLPS